MTSSSLKDSSLYLQRLGYTAAPLPTLPNPMIRAAPAHSASSTRPSIEG